MKYDVCIVGAGVVGCTLGHALAKQGKKVLVIERDLEEPNKFIGELLQPGGVESLLKLGWPKSAFEEIDSPEVSGYALFKDGQEFSIPYEQIEGKVAIGQGFRYGKFIGRLRKFLTEQPNVTLVGGKVTDLMETDESVFGVEYIPNGETQKISAPASLTVVSDGGYSTFRKGLSNNDREIRSYMLALLLEDADLPYPGHGHVFIGRQPFLAYPVTSRHTRMLIDFPKDQPPKKGEALTNFLMTEIRDAIPEQMHPSFDHAVKTYPFKAMPSCEIPADPIRKKGAVLIGDSLNMRHPITGGGMTVGLTDVKYLSDLLAGLTDYSDLNSLNGIIESFYDTRHEATSAVNILANALYKVLSHEELSQACFDYLGKGGKHASEPIQLLAGISTDRKMLIEHFMAVAKSGATNKLKPFPTPARIKAAKNMVGDAIDIIEPQLDHEKFGDGLKSLIKVGKMVTG
ncbi:MAG: squalene monooxygenase [Bacteroidia bacterium]|jgi:squalene monooxygenase